MKQYLIYETGWNYLSLAHIEIEDFEQAENYAMDILLELRGMRGISGAGYWVRIEEWEVVKGNSTRINFFELHYNGREFNLYSNQSR